MQITNTRETQITNTRGTQITNTQETQIKRAVRHHLTPIRTVITERIEITNAGEDAERRQPSYTVGGNVNWCRYCGKQYGGSSKT